MTRKDYVAIAAAIRREVEQWPEHGTHWNMARAIADSVAAAMKADNPRFDRERFLSACGFTD